MPAEIDKEWRVFYVITLNSWLGYWKAELFEDFDGEPDDRRDVERPTSTTLVFGNDPWEMYSVKFNYGH